MTVLNLTQFLPQTNPTISSGTASDGIIKDATSEEPNINSVPPPTTGKFTETNQLHQQLEDQLVWHLHGNWLDSSHVHLYKHLQIVANQASTSIIKSHQASSSIIKHNQA